MNGQQQNQDDDDLASSLRVVESKRSVVSSSATAPLSLDIAVASTKDCQAVVFAERGQSVGKTKDHTISVAIPCLSGGTCVVNGGESSPGIVKSANHTTGNEDKMEDWNIVPVSPFEEGETSMIPSHSTSDEERQIPAKESTPETATKMTSVSLHVSTSDLQDLRRSDEEHDVNNNAPEGIDPIRMLRKGVVAALGGTMVGVGLIMIPLPTPFGAVIAGSGMAVLGTEFDGVKDINAKMTDTAKTHWETTRERLINGIESMEGKQSIAIENTTDGSEEDEGLSSENKDSSDSPTKKAPFPIMNAAEQRRQEELAKQRKENQQQQQQPNFFSHWKRSTGSYLSKHVLPILKGSTEESGNKSLPDTDRTVQSETETLSDENESFRELQESDEKHNKPLVTPEQAGSNEPAEAFLSSVKRFLP